MCPSSRLNTVNLPLITECSISFLSLQTSIVAASADKLQGNPSPTDFVNYSIIIYSWSHLQHYSEVITGKKKISDKHDFNT